MEEVRDNLADGLGHQFRARKLFRCCPVPISLGVQLKQLEKRREIRKELISLWLYKKNNKL
jgi:hypothetical protein